MYKDKLTDYFENNRSEFVNTIIDLVSVSSEKGEATEGMPFGKDVNNALLKAIEIAKKLGFETKNYDGYVAAIDFSDKKTELDMLAHLDVVPANPDEWTICHPYEPIEKDGRIYGRGTADDKGPAVAALFAMKVIQDLNIPLKNNVRLILGTDEESGSDDIEYYYKKEKPAPATFSPDGYFPVVNVEKGRLTGEIIGNYSIDTDSPQIVSVKGGSVINVIPDYIVAKIKGLTVSQIEPIISEWEKRVDQKAKLGEEDGILTIETKGKAGHAAHPDKANNAATGMIDLLASLPLGNSDYANAIKVISKLFPHGKWGGEGLGVDMRDDISDELTLSLNILDLTEDKIRVAFDCRRPICSNKENTMDVIDKMAADNGFKFNQINVADPHHVPAESPFIKTLLSAYEKYTGKKGTTSIEGGGTYVHGLENGVAFGAGSRDVEYNMHGVHEFAIVDELITASKIYAQVIIDICG